MSMKKWAEADQGSAQQAVSVLGQRYHQGEAEPAAPEPAPAVEPDTESQIEPTTSTAPSTRATSRGKKSRPHGTTRSWYLPDDVADQLEEAATELYHDLRGRHTKRVVLGTLIRHGLKHQAQAKKELERTKP